MSAFQPSDYSGEYSAAEAKNYAKEAGKEAKLSAGLDKASKAVAATGAAASVVAPPWSLIVTAAAAATALGIKVASAVSGRNARALAGDEAAIASFIKRANKMKAAKRKHLAEKLLAQLHRHQQHKKHGRPWKVRDNVLKMKLGALYAVEQHHAKKPHEKLDPDGPTPAEVEQRSDGYLGVPTWGWVGGVALIGLGAVFAGTRARRNPSTTEEELNFVDAMIEGGARGNDQGLVLAALGRLHGDPEARRSSRFQRAVDAVDAWPLDAYQQRTGSRKRVVALLRS